MAVKSTVPITLDLALPSYTMVYAAQNDKLSRYVNASLVNNSAAWPIPAGATCVIRYSKPDGTGGFYDTDENGAAAYTFTAGQSSITFYICEQALTVAGDVRMELNFYQSGARLSTFAFTISVQEAALTDETIVSSDYYNVLTATLSEMNQIAAEVRAAYGAPLTAATAAAMTDHTRVYVYTGSESGYTAGNWYYWNGSAWTSGGVYNSTAFTTDTTLTIAGAAADAKATGDQVGELKSALNDTNADIEYTQNAVGVYKNYWNPDDVVANHYHANGAAVESTVYSYIIIPCKAGDVFYFGNGGVSANALFVNILTASGANISTINNVASYEIPATSIAKLIAVTFSNDYSKPQINKGRLFPYVEYGGSTVVNDLAQKVDKDGENQVKRQNLEGVAIGNYFAAFGELDREGYYATANSTNISLTYTANAALNCYIVKVKKNTDYTITYGRFLVLLDANKRSLAPTIAYAQTFNSGNAEYISVSFDPTTYPVDTYKICEAGTDTVDAYVYPDWLHPVKPITKTEAMTIPVGVDDNGKLYAAEQTLTPKKYKSLFAVGDISDGESLMTDKETALKKGESLTFSCNITSFDKLIIGWSRSDPNTQKRPYCEITNTRIIVNGTNSNGPAAPYLTHGLTITVNLQFRMTVKYNSIDVELISNGERYTGTANVFKAEQGYCFAMSEGSALTDCRLSWCGSDINKTVWMFGDSYFGLTNTARWPYYMQEDGYADNALLDAYPGRNTTNALLTLNSLIALGKPDYIVWCLGMNDGSDTNANTPTTAWATGRDAVLSICESYGIIPVFATIPNVPNIRHTGKNAWIKSSGYRYIDFAQAVGASESGSSWYEGMLSTDNVHPTAKGAKALYGQVLSDFPEVTIP